ncbi:MAG: flagellar hook-basal body protein [Oscillospiraceae bacterium]
MLNGFYTAASGMLMQQRGLSVSANNMANVNTPGFKTEMLLAKTYSQGASVKYENGKKTVIGANAPIKIVESVPTKFDSSSIKESERPYDMSVYGEGFFNVETEAGRVLTRNGNFDIDEEGYLVLPNVGRVLGENGHLLIGGSNFIVLGNGSVYNEDGDNIDNMLITQIEVGDEVQKLENGMYITNNLNNITQIDGGVRQFTLEDSNIDLNREFAMVMEMQKSFNACSVALKNIDQINSKTVNEIGRV